MEKYKTLQFNKLAFIPLLLGIIAVYLRQIFNHDFIAILLLLVALSFSVWYYVIKLKKCLDVVNLSTGLIGACIDLLAINFLIVNFFVISAYVTKLANVCYIVIFILLFLSKCLFISKKIVVIKIKKHFDIIFFVCICALLSVLPNLEIFSTWFRWDSYIYLFDFYKLSPLSVFVSGGLRVAQHVTFTYSLTALLVQSALRVDMKYAVLIINVIVMFCEMLIWYGLLKRYASAINKYLAMALSIVFAFSPYVFGMLYTINLEQILLVGSLLFFLAEVKEDCYLLVFSALITCNAKETGTVLVVCMMIAYVLKQVVNVLKDKKKGERLKTIIFECDWLIYIAVIIVGLLWFRDFITSKWQEYNATIPLETVDGSAFNKISFSFVFIVSKIKSLLFVNFNWLLFLVVISAGVFFIIKATDRKVEIIEFVKKFAIPLSCFIG